MLRCAIPHIPITHALAIPALRLTHTSALRHTHSLTARAHALSQQPRPFGARGVSGTRSFTSTTQRQADEDPNMQRVFAQQQKLLKLFQEKPEVLESIKAFVGQLKDYGVDVESGQMPSKTDMFRLLMKAEVRESAMKMAATFQEAGIDMQSKDMMQSLMAMQRQLKGM